MSHVLQALSQILERRLGVSMRSGRLGSLADAVALVAGGRSTEQLIRQACDPQEGPALLDRIADAMTIRETYFFREQAPLRTFDWSGALERARADGSEHVRVWSAACSSGEEPYSAALLAMDALGDAAPPVRIVATDISATALQEARAARYTARAVRHVPPPLRDRWFDRQDGTYVLDQAVRDLVHLERHSLANDPPPAPGRFDLVLCRNVLMYLEPWAVRHAHETLRSALAPGGGLVLGAVDRLSLGQAVPRTRPPAQRRADRRTGRTAAPHRPERRAAPRPAPPPVSAPVPATTEHALTRASSLADEGKLAEALGVVQMIVATDPMDASARFLEGTLLLALGRPGEAVPALRAALYANANFALAAFQLARALDQLGEPGASQAYQRALGAMEAASSAEEDVVGPAGLRDLMRVCAAKAVQRSRPTTPASLPTASSTRQDR